MIVLMQPLKGKRRRGKVVRFLSAGFLLAILFSGTALGEGWDASDIAWFVAGGATAFVVHESAHALVATSFRLHPRLEWRSKPIPFVVVKYDIFAYKDASGRTIYLNGQGERISSGDAKRFAISSAGINSQNIGSELILSMRPRLSEESAPFLKGMLAFDILTSIGYALVGRQDPDGDIRGMSEALGVSDRIIGAIVFLPAAVDLYRFYYPDSAWAPWVGRGAKGYLLGLSFRW